MNNRGHASHGFSLIEVVIVLVIVAILATFAIMALGGSAENLERQNIAKEFKVALERARFDSVKRRPATCAEQARVEILSATQFAVITDQDQN
jgi:prepilin-type N-terminal cleavage/methylation domain-containing protein